MDAILTFHSIDASGSVLSYAPDELERLLEGLLEGGVRVVSLAELLGEAAADARRVALTFDDGFRTIHEAALPVLARLGLPSTLYVVSDYVGRDNCWPTQPADAPRFELLSWGELAELVAAGVEIGCHTATHPHLERMGTAADEAWKRELEDSRAALEDRLGVAVRHFAYPYGSFDDAAVARVEPLYDTAVTADMGYLERGAARYRLPRLDSYYLRHPERHQPLFGARTRLYLGLRAGLRRLRSRLVG